MARLAMVAPTQAIRRHTGMQVYGVVLGTRRHMVLRRMVAVETRGEQLGLLLQDPLSPIPDRARTCTVSRLLDVTWTHLRPLFFRQNSAKCSLYSTRYSIWRLSSHSQA